MQRLSHLLLLTALLNAAAAMGAPTYPQPLPTGFSPTSGPPGTVITFTGSGFTGLTQVWVGNGKDSTVYVVSDSLVKVTVPADATTGHVGLINPQLSEFTSTNFTVTAGTAPTPPSPTPPSPSGGSGSISGAVSGTANPIVQLTSTTTQTATPNSSGGYSFNGVANGTYTLRATAAGHVFTPTSFAAKVAGSAIGNVNFTGAATSAPTYTLSGTIGGAIASYVTVTLNGANVGSASTDLGGTYSFLGLAPGTYTVSASLPGYAFTQSRTVTLGNVDSIENNFTSTAMLSSGTLQLTAVNPLPAATVGRSYSTTVVKSISGYKGSYRLQTGNYSSGAPPVGMLLNANGTLTGTPATAGKYTFEVCAADSSGDVTETCAPTAITVAAASTPPPSPTPPSPTPPSPTPPAPTPPAPTPPAPTPPSPPPAAGSFWIFYNGAFNWGGDWPFDANLNYQDTSGGPLSGAYDVQVSLTSQWGGWIPWAQNFDFNSVGYTKLTLALKPTIANQQWSIGFVNVGDVPVGIYLNLANYGPAPVAGKWGTYTIPLSDLGVLGSQIYKFVLQDQTGLSNNTWYVDNVGFVP